MRATTITRCLALTTIAIFSTACGPKTGSAPSAGQSGELTLAEAEAIVADVESRWPMRADHPLLTPASLDDVEAILKLDQIKLFPAGIAFAQKDDSLRGMTLAAQIELAWGEGYMILVEIMGNLHKQLVKYIEPMRARADKGELAEGLQKELEVMETLATNTERAADAFTMMIIKHLSKGLEKAEVAIEKHPDSYLGYRVAADYYRLMEAWEPFDEMIAKVRERNPDSNGLRFLEGAKAFQVTHDKAAAVDFYAKALETDPAFIRAQAHLMMVQTDAASMYGELEKLREKNPEHQIVAWATEGVRKAYEAWKKEQEGEGGEADAPPES